MQRNEISVVIDRPVEEVFEFTVNPKNTSLWIGSIVEESRSSEDVQIGVTYTNKDKTGKQTTYRVSAYEKNARFQLEKVDGDYKTTYIYEPLSEGRSTKLTYIEEVSLGQLDSPLEQSVLGNLKHLLEKDFLGWIGLKEKLHYKSHKPPFLSEGDIW